MTRGDFERLLDKTAEQLNKEVRESAEYHKPDDFQKRVLEVMQAVAKTEKLKVEPSFHIHGFPDIHANGYGVEVKSTNKDSWLSVGNSVFEGMRDARVKQVYVMFGKMGGMPAVKWGRYEDCITHVRISHAPRFVLEMEPESAAGHRPWQYPQSALRAGLDRVGVSVLPCSKNAIRRGSNQERAISN